MLNAKTTRRARRDAWLAALAGLALAVATGAWLISGCATVGKIGATAAQATGAISEEEAASINRTIDAVDRTFKDITPEQEYYIGRAVTATLLDSYDVWDHPEATRYVNLLGQTLAMASDCPETFAGYHFLLRDSDEINAFAAPGGFILVTRGMVDLCDTEDALAAVLAHEIGHVAGKHGLRAIKNSRLTSALTIIAAESARTFGSEDLKQLVEDYEGSISDITSTLVTNGYSRGLEQEADEAAIAVMRRVGYNPRALADMLAQMKQRLRPGGLDFARTHPDPQDRIDSVQLLLAGLPAVDEPGVRHRRLVAAVK
jgi:predicted Zn-dependent protease